jgi:hypothetical protein
MNDPLFDRTDYEGTYLQALIEWHSDERWLYRKGHIDPLVFAACSQMAVGKWHCDEPTVTQTIFTEYWENYESLT